MTRCSAAWGAPGGLWAHEWVEAAQPDIMAIAKALGGGFPVAACLSTERAVAGMTPGAHGSTFGGNPLAMAVAQKALELISDQALLAHVRTISDLLRKGLAELQAHYPDVIAEVRGRGLLIGVRVTPPNRDVIAAARDEGLLVAGGGENCIRLLPPLNLTHAEAAEVLNRLRRSLAAFRAPALAA